MGCPGDQALGCGKSDTPSDPIFSSLHFCHPRASHQTPVEKEPLDQPLVVHDGACGVSVAQLEEGVRALAGL